MAYALVQGVGIAAIAMSMFSASASVAASCVNASSFGWNATNATSALQAAIDSGAEKVVIDRQAGDWIVDPVFLRRSNQTIVVSDGVAVRARKGAFRAKGDCLVTIPHGVSNVVLRGVGSATLAMNKRDYQDVSRYSHSEWRHAVSIAGAHDVFVGGLTILSSGGDGVYIRNASTNVRLDRLVCRDHHRQGISVISAVNLRVTNCRFDGTYGTAPQCGLDIEPNNAKDRLEDIVFEDCAFEGNAASGIMLHLVPLNDTTRPVSISFRRCTSRGNGFCGVRINCAGPDRRAVRGGVSFEDCAVSGSRSYELIIAKKRSDALDVSFKNCTFDAQGSAADVLRFDNGTFLSDFGGVSCENVRVVPGKGRPISFDGADGVGIVCDTMQGAISIVNTDGSVSPVSLRDFARAYPPKPEALRVLIDFKTRPLDYRSLVPTGRVKPLDAPVSTGWLRRRFTFVQRVPAAGDYPIVFRARVLGKRRPSVRVQVLDAAGTDLGAFVVADAVVTNVIHATGAGIRRFEVSVDSGLASVESAWPGQGLQADTYVHLFGGRNRRYWFAVPAGAQKVLAQVNPEEPCSAKLLTPSGAVAAEKPYGRGLAVLEAMREKTSAPEVWCIEFPRIDEDASFRIGSPALPLALTCGSL